jgi:hypothetical protein
MFRFVLFHLVILIWVCLFCDGLLERLLLLGGSTSLEVLCCACLLSRPTSLEVLVLVLVSDS